MAVKGWLHHRSTGTSEDEGSRVSPPGRFPFGITSAGLTTTAALVFAAENSLLIYICRIKKHTNAEFLNSVLRKSFIEDNGHVILLKHCPVDLTRECWYTGTKSSPLPNYMFAGRGFWHWLKNSVAFIASGLGFFAFSTTIDPFGRNSSFLILGDWFNVQHTDVALEMPTLDWRIPSDPTADPHFWDWQLWDTPLQIKPALSPLHAPSQSLSLALSFSRMRHGAAQHLNVLLDPPAFRERWRSRQGCMRIS